MLEIHRRRARKIMLPSQLLRSRCRRFRKKEHGFPLTLPNAVEHWLAAPAENYGLMLRMESEQQEIPVAQFYSSEAFKGCHDGLCGGKRVAFRPAFVLLKK